MYWSSKAGPNRPYYYNLRRRPVTQSVRTHFLGRVSSCPMCSFESSDVLRSRAGRGQTLTATPTRNARVRRARLGCRPPATAGLDFRSVVVCNSLLHCQGVRLSAGWAGHRVRPVPAPSVPCTASSRRQLVMAVADGAGTDEGVTRPTKNVVWFKGQNFPEARDNAVELSCRPADDAAPELHDVNVTVTVPASFTKFNLQVTSHHFDPSVPGD